MKNLKLLSVLGLSLLLNFTSFAQSTITIPNNPLVKNYLSSYLTNGVCTTNIIVPAHNVLIATGLIRMADNTKITLEPGALLYLNNATLTHEDDLLGTSNTVSKFWSGIFAKGSPTASQEVEQDYVCNQIISFNCMESAGSSWTTDNPCYFKRLNFNQAVVYVNNSKIRYSYVGISAGDEAFDVAQYTVENEPRGTQGGALLHISNNEFENNFESALTFAPYPNFRQLSVIQDNTFTTEFSVNNQPIKPNTSIVAQPIYLKVAHNSFKNEIMSNTFEFIDASFGTNYSSYCGGIRFYSTRATIRLNNFRKLEEGIRILNGNPTLTRRLSINYNEFYANTEGILDVSGDWNSIKKNTFIVPTPVYYEQNSYAVYSVNNNLNVISDNQIFSENASTIKDKGLIIKDNDMISSLIYNNEISLIHQSLQSENDNSKVQVSCNKFSQSKQRDIYVVSSPGLNNQGSPFVPAGNKFSQLSSGQYNIDNFLGNSLIYYYNTALEDPTLSRNINKLTSAGTKTCDISYDYLIPNPICNKLTTLVYSDYVGLKNTTKSNYIQLEEDLVLIENGGVSTSEEDEYNRTLNAYDITLGDLIETYSNLMLADSMPDSTYGDSIIQVLTNHKTFAGDFMLLQYFIGEKDYSSATSLIGTLRTTHSSDTPILEYCDYMELMVQYGQNSLSTDWLKNNFSTLKSIADGNGLMADKAKVLTQAAVDCDPLNIYHGTILYTWVPVDSSGNPPGDTSGIVVTKYPNPFTSTISVDIENTKNYSRTFSVLLKDMQGNLIDSKLTTVSNGQTNTEVLNSGSATTGYYYIYIEENGTQLYYGLVYKN